MYYKITVQLVVDCLHLQLVPCSTKICFLLSVLDPPRLLTLPTNKKWCVCVCVCVCVCDTMLLCYATNKIRNSSCTYKNGSTIIKVMRSELNSLNVIKVVVRKKNVKRVKIRNEIKDRRRLTVLRSVPRCRFDYCSIQIQ